MNKPTNKPKEIKEKCNLIGDISSIEAKELLDISSEMIDKNILYLTIDSDGDTYHYHEPKILQTRLETQLEADVRYAKELKQYEKEKERQKTLKEQQIEKLKKEAKKLGLNVS